MARRAPKTTYLSGLDKVMKNLNNEISKIENRSLKGMIRSTIIIRRSMEDTTPTIPVDQGNLRASWFTVSSKGETAQGSTAAFKGEDAGKMSAQHSSTISSAKAALATERRPVVMMGFSANYAGWVHEMIGVNWKRPGSGAKFFQAAIRRNFRPVLRAIANDAKIK